MSNIENLKKQAKQVLRWHRDQRWTVATDIRNTLPEFQGLTDREVFERQLKLADAQTLIARRNGYSTWPELVTALAAAPRPAKRPERARAASQVVAALPFIYVRDTQAALAFYEEKLGFKTEFAYGEPSPYYAQVIRDGVRLAIKHADPEVFEALGPLRKALGDEFVAASLSLDAAKPLFGEYERAGARFYQTLRRETWGAWSFIVEDPDGNLLVFGGDDDRAPPGD